MLDLPSHLANQVWVTAQAQGRPVADVVCAAVAEIENELLKSEKLTVLFLPAAP